MHIFFGILKNNSSFDEKLAFGGLTPKTVSVWRKSGEF
jgi:hypothetical protein